MEVINITSMEYRVGTGIVAASSVAYCKGKEAQKVMAFGGRLWEVLKELMCCTITRLNCLHFQL